MNELLRRRYKTAEKRAADAEAELRRASEHRLAELMKLPPRRRLGQIEDPALTTADRLKLRRSIAGNLRHKKQYALLFGGRPLLIRLLRTTRYVPTAAAVTAVVAPILIAVNMAWNNTDDVIVLPQPIELNWRLPSGATERKVMPADARLAIAPQSGTLAVARRWIEGQGYATAQVNIIGR